MAGKSENVKEIHSVLTLLRECQASINVLFCQPSAGKLRISDIDRGPFIRKLLDTVDAMCNDCASLESEPASAQRIYHVISPGVDFVDLLNALVLSCAEQPFAHQLEASILDVFISCEVFNTNDLRRLNADRSVLYRLNHANRLWTLFKTIIPNVIELFRGFLESPDEALSRVDPGSSRLKTTGALFQMKNGRLTRRSFDQLHVKALEADPFREHQAFRYLDGDFEPANLTSVRKVDQFYGFPEARESFRSYFRLFADKSANYPLLISSLPGLGKTHFTIAHALAYQNLTLILPEPADLEKPLEHLIHRLSLRRNRQFVVFFDDVDTRSVDWYYFRTNVGGSFVLPENITLVIASNYPFPANISSRGRGFVFPRFDEIRCQEMVRDFLKSMGMTMPSAELVSVIAADYVEEFGQKMFEELSPRTLVRYLDRYYRDMNKRKRMLDLAREDVITRPDPQVFLEVNVRVMKALYGEEAVSELQDEELAKLAAF